MQVTEDEERMEERYWRRQKEREISAVGEDEENMEERHTRRQRGEREISAGDTG